MNTASLGACDVFNFMEKCAESATMCEALFATNGNTCDSQCQSLGFTCEEGWDEEEETCASKLTHDTRRVGDGCGMPYGGQICRCTKSSQGSKGM